MEKEITKRQKEVLNYVKKYVVDHGFPPSTREIGAALGLSSPATVHTHLEKLIEAGYLKKMGSKLGKAGMILGIIGLSILLLIYVSITAIILTI